jgi:hypothetical protein
MKTKKGQDLTDLPKDKKKLAPEEATINLPDTKDIPGQEDVTSLPLGELADTTSSSADEEGEGILDNPDDAELTNQEDTNVTREERKALRDAAEKIRTQDEQNLEDALPDQYDEDGEPLNEKGDVSGSDLDVPGSELDDDDEDIGEEDEENNSYSLQNEEEDKNTERQ